MIDKTRIWKTALLLPALFMATLLVAPSAQAKSKAKYDLKLATVAPPDTPWSAALEVLAKQIGKRSGGEARMRLFLASQLGGELEIIDGVQLGTVEMGGVSTGALASVIPELNIFELPFMWDSSEQCYYVLDNILLTEVRRLFKAKGLVALGWTENGWRHFHTKDHPIRTPEDLRGLKIRSQQNKYHLAFWKALRANARPIGMTEVFNALQTGQVDAGENTLILTAATGWVEAIKYVSLSGHIYQPAVIFTKQEIWDSWPKNLQKIITEEALKAQDMTRAQLALMEPELVESFKAMGIIINTLTPEERDLFKEKTLSVKKQYRKEFGAYGDKLLKLIEDGKKEYNEKHGGR